MLVSWPSLVQEVENCRKCRLYEGRTLPVPGEGNLHARLMFIGEGPGRDEDLTGRPFVGRAGQLLDKMIAAMGLSREEVYITNVVKCRPPQNRAPEADEAAACMPYLRAQVGLIRPQIIVLLGASALGAVLGHEHRITKERGLWVDRKGVAFMPPFHPAAHLRDESKKRLVWEDRKKVRDRLLASGGPS